MSMMPITRVVLYKHGVGYFEREGSVKGDQSVGLEFKQAEVSDVLKSLTILDLDGGHVASVSYDSTKPLEELLAGVALTIPEGEGLAGLLPQLRGARVRAEAGGKAREGMILGLDTVRSQTADGVVEVANLSLLGDDGEIRSLELRELSGLAVLDEAVGRDLEFYLKTQLSAKKKDARSFAIFARGEGTRRLRMAYTVAAPVWKATYRLILGEEEHPPMIQGWAVVDNTQDEDWENVTLSLVAGLPVSFVHDLYTPRYIRRPVVEVKETTGVLPPGVEEGMEVNAFMMEDAPGPISPEPRERGLGRTAYKAMMAYTPEQIAEPRSAVSSTPAQVRERKLGDLFEYQIEHPVTIRRNQAALVPIVLREFKGRPVLLHNKQTRPENPMRCVEFENSTGLTLEGGPVTVLEGGSYVGEAMLETLKPDETRLIPFAVELGVRVLDKVDHRDGHVSRVVIDRGTLESRYGQVSATTYHFHSKGDAPAVVYLDHPREGDDWSLVEPASAHEVTPSYWRFRFDLARGVTSFVVRKERILSLRYAIAQVGDHQLEAWISQRYLDPPTEQALRRAFALRGRAAETEQKIRKLGDERKEISNAQERIRENLKALGDRSAEKELRERFVRSLNGQEDRLEAIAAEAAALTNERERLLREMADAIGTLNYAADLGPREAPQGRKGRKPEAPEAP